LNDQILETISASPSQLCQESEFRNCDASTDGKNSDAGTDGSKCD
jgi:hypothetical protein